jgi:hypothetical protein
VRRRAIHLGAELAFCRNGSERETLYLFYTQLHGAYGVPYTVGQECQPSGMVVAVQSHTNGWITFFLDLTSRVALRRWQRICDIFNITEMQRQILSAKDRVYISIIHYVGYVFKHHEGNRKSLLFPNEALEADWELFGNHNERHYSLSENEFVEGIQHRFFQTQVPWFDYVDRAISQLESVPGVVLPDSRPDPILTNTQVLLAIEVMPPKHHQPSENLPPANSNLDTDLVDSNLPPIAATAALPSSVAAAPLITAMDLPSLQVDGLVPLRIIVESSTSPLVGKRKVNSLGVLQGSLHTAATTDAEETMEEPPHKTTISKPQQ